MPLLVTTYKEVIYLVCVGLKYNKNNILQFVIKIGSGSTKEMFSYESFLSNRYSRIFMHHVASTDMIYKYLNLWNVSTFKTKHSNFTWWSKINSWINIHIIYWLRWWCLMPVRDPRTRNRTQFQPLYLGEWGVIRNYGVFKKF